MILKFIWKGKILEQPKQPLENKEVGVLLTEMHYKAKVMKTVSNGRKVNRSVGKKMVQKQPHIHATLILDKVQRQFNENQNTKNSLLNKWCRNKWISICKK